MQDSSTLLTRELTVMSISSQTQGLCSSLFKSCDRGGCSYKRFLPPHASITRFKRTTAKPLWISYWSILCPQTESGHIEYDLTRAVGKEVKSRPCLLTLKKTFDVLSFYVLRLQWLHLCKCVNNCNNCIIRIFTNQLFLYFTEAQQL